MSLPLEDRLLFTSYRALRLDIAVEGKGEALEVKKSGKGILSWSTRGQLGIGSTIKATTGFQTGDLTHSELVGVFKDVLKSREKQIEFVQQRLRGAKDIFTKGGHVTRVFKDQKFRMLYDNRRQILEPLDFKGVDVSSVLLDSKPLCNIEQAKKQRFLSKFPFSLPYNKIDSNRSRSGYKTYLEMGVRNFIKGYVAKEPLFGLRGDEFKSYSELITFISDFKSTKCVNVKLRLSKQSISNLKMRKVLGRPTPRTPENLEFVEYLKEKIPHFIHEAFIHKRM